MQNLSLFRLLPILLASILIISACEEELQNPLQTDQAAEGHEMFDVSFALNEHLYFVLLEFEEYSQAVADTLVLPGCPNVQVDSLNREIILNFPQACENTNLSRQGSITIAYPEQDSVLRSINYVDYRVRNNSITGSRILYSPTNDTLPGIRDSFESLMIYDEHGSSTRVSGNLAHDLLFEEEQLLEFTTSGWGNGRNLAGRPFTFNISSPKTQLQECVDAGNFLPATGVEDWIFDRTNSDNVRHQIRFGEVPTCDNNAEVLLSDGRNLQKSP
jgi:hypothetical protein